MANISSYPLGTPGSGDLIPGTQKVTDVNGETKNLTKNFTVSQVAGFANVTAAYTVYTALVTQTGGTAPTATVLQNTTGDTLTWARTGAGTYTVTSSTALFTTNKTAVFCNVGNGEPNQMLMWTRTSNTVITLTTNGSDGRITGGAFEVRIYS
tara:strand:- start:907 stop:1365 length:459 start_codon:yes stop_codon:yes gene_type:complete